MSRNHCLVVVLAWAVAGFAPKEEAPAPTIRLNHAGPAVFEVTGLAAADLAKLARIEWKPEQWTALLAVYVENGTTTTAQPAMLGEYRVAGNVLRFEPQFPLVLGVTYRVVFDPSRLPGRAGVKAAPVVARFALPKPKPAAATVVEQVYPTRRQLPENQLKFYLHFSAAMSRGEAYRHIQLLSSAGKPIESAFLELGEELWDPQGKRFTLLIDPGRIKSGLKPREDLGPVLEAGKSYTLVIDRRWADAAGNPLKETYRKTFTVGAADEQPIDPKTWKLRIPAAGTTEPLAIAFPKPLDHALLQRLLWVTDAKGRKLAGVVAVSAEETRWQFTPEKPWTAGTYQLMVDTSLEDLAGNRVGEKFEVDVLKPIQRTTEAKVMQLPFVVGAKSAR